MARYSIVTGDITKQDVDCIVNSWNRNFLPWWILIPQGVSCAIRKKAGHRPFAELARKPMIPLGHAVVTSAGRLPYKAIIHVAGINLVWRGSEYSIRSSTISAIRMAEQQGFQSIAMPIIGAGSGGFNKAKSLAIITQTLEDLQTDLQILIVSYSRK